MKLVSVLKRLSSRSVERGAARVARGKRSRRLSLESLEDRRVLAAIGSDAVPFSSLIPSSESYDASRLLVQYREGITSVSSLAAYVSGTNVGEGWSLVPGWREVQLNPGIEIEAAIQAFAADGNVLFAQPDYRVSVQMTPNDPLFGRQWDFKNTGQNGGKPGADISATAAWDVTTGNNSVIVAVIDTGVDYNHPDLYKNIWINQSEIPASRRANLTDIDGDGLITFGDLNDPQNQGSFKITDINKNGRIDGGDILAPLQKDKSGQDTGGGGWANGVSDDGDRAYIDDLVGWNAVSRNNNPQDDYFHGTHVAGTIAAAMNDGIGVAGVAPHARIMPLKFLGADGSGSTSDAITALNYAVANGATISNNSWGGGAYDYALFQAIQRAAAAGHIFVAAAGNDGSNNDSAPSYPASYNLANIVSVAATDSSDNLAYFSNYGKTSVDIAAPGVDIYSTLPTTATDPMLGRGLSTGYGSLNGTSMAAPHVAGAAALVRAQHPDWSNTQVIQQILSSTDTITGLKNRVATGRLDVAAALGNSNPDPTPTPPPPPPADTIPPRIVSSVPAAPGAVYQVTLTFSEAINSSTFDTSDVTRLEGPYGPIYNFQVNPVPGNSRQFDVTFETQTTPGAYTLVIGPHISDLAGNEVDQNGNGVPGEYYWDDYTATFSIDGAPPPPTGTSPSILRADPSTEVAGPLDHVRLTFSEAIDPATFDNSDIVSFSGPYGYIYVQTVSPVGSDGTQFDVLFDSQSVAGTYWLTVGPHISSLGGQEIDQNGDGISGDDYYDTFTASFSIVSTFTVASSDVPKTVRGFAAVASTLTIDQDVSIADLDVQLNLTYPRDGNLAISLVSPSGTSINLAYRRGGNKAGFRDTIFDDQAAKPISSGKAPFAGSFRPEEPLASFTGESALGTWKLIIQNVTNVNGRGTLNSWSLTVTPEAAPGGGDPDPTPVPPGNGTNQPPLAGDDAFAVMGDSRLTVGPADLLANDYDPEGSTLYVTAAGNGTGGTATLNPDGSVSFMPDPGFAGLGSFLYLVSDGELVTAGNVLVQVLPAFPWNNSLNVYDVDRDGAVAPNDALLVINALNSVGSTTLTGALDYVNPTTFYDVSRDNYVSPVDALLVINHLNESALRAASGEGESATDELLTALAPASGGDTAAGADVADSLVASLSVPGIESPDLAAVDQLLTADAALALMELIDYPATGRRRG